MLVTDAQERAVLAGIRGLAAAGFEIEATATARAAPGLWSTAVSRRHLTPDPRLDLAGFLASLETILRDSPVDFLLAGTDASLLAVSRHREVLSRHVEIGLPAPEAVERALNKATVAEAARRAGVAPPPTVVCRTPEEASRAALGFGYPVLVKPVHTVVERGGGNARRASVLVRDESQLRRIVARLEQCLIQQRISGSVISVGGVAAGGELLAAAPSRYLRTYPPAAGNVAFSETIIAPSSLLTAIRTLIATLGWEGLFELELLEGPDGRLAAIDFNPRMYGSLALAEAAGLGLPALWCRWLSGERPGPFAGPRVGVRYRWEDAELRGSLARLRRGRARSALAVLAPRRDVTHAYYAPGDTRPMFVRVLQLAGKPLERRRLAKGAEPHGTATRGSAEPRRWSER